MTVHVYVYFSCDVCDIITVLVHIARRPGERDSRPWYWCKLTYVHCIFVKL